MMGLLCCERAEALRLRLPVTVPTASHGPVVVDVHGPTVMVGMYRMSALEALDQSIQVTHTGAVGDYLLPAAGSGDMRLALAHAVTAVTGGLK